jgi:serine/threonine protein kinase
MASQWLASPVAATDGTSLHRRSGDPPKLSTRPSSLFTKGNFYELYSEGDFIAEGGRTKVQVITELETNKLFVGKFIKDIIWRDVEMEIRIAQYLASPGVLEAYKYFKVGQNAYVIIMEYLGPEWITLSSYINKERIDAKDARMIFLQLVDIVEFIHGKGYAHNDIKCIII